MTTTPESLLGQDIHFVGPFTVPTSTAMFAASASFDYGDALTVTEEVLEAGYDRKRAHWLELVSDEDAQVERYGEQKFALGPFPDYLPREDPNHVTLASLMTEKYVNTSVTTQKWAVR